MIFFINTKLTAIEWKISDSDIWKRTKVACKSNEIYLQSYDTVQFRSSDESNILFHNSTFHSDEKNNTMFKMQNCTSR